MNRHWKNTLAVLSCTFVLAACPDDDKPGPKADDSEQDDRDAGSDERDPSAGAAGKPSSSKPDAGQSPPPVDAGSDEPKPSSDAGSADPAPSDPAVPAGGASFFLPTTTPDNTTTPRVQIDADGGMHMLYSAYAVKDAYYAYCPKGCTGQQDMKVVQLETEGTAHGMLAITQDGKPRALLSTLVNLYYAECNEQCTEQANWTISKIADLNGDRDVTGDAFALDPQGRPRFIMHTYLAYLGIGQKDPETWFAQCDSSCNDAAQWRFDSIQKEIWYGSQLKYDGQGRAHLLTGIVTTEQDVGTYKLGAYLTCEGTCSSEADWNGIGLTPLFETDIEEIKPSFGLALTKAGQPRVIALAKAEDGARKLLYYECDSDCANDNWSGTLLSDHAKLGSGLDLALDSKDQPRFVFTLDHNIGLHYCDADHCTAENSPWGLTKVEMSDAVPPDNIILWPNCTVDLWFLHDPKLALTSDGAVRVGYQASDISGGTHNSDPTSSPCVAGKDMVLSRMTMFPSYK